MHLALLRNNRIQLVYSTLGCIQKVFTERKAACLDYDFSGGYTIAANGTLQYRMKPEKEAELFRQSDDADGQSTLNIGF